MTESAKLSEEKLLECFKSLNVPVRMNDLKIPTKEFVLLVFNVFLRDLQINLASPLLQPFESIRHLENLEIYEESSMLIILSFVMTQLLSNICPITITFSDLTAPKPKRTKKIFNYLVILWNNYLRKDALFQKVEKSLEEEIQKFKDIKRESDALIEEYQKCMIILQGKQFASDELKKHLAVKQEKDDQLEKYKGGLIEQYNQLKEKETCIKTEIANDEISIVTLKEKLNELEQQIISSPEKLSAGIIKLKDKVKEFEDKVPEKELERKEIKKNYQLLEKAEEFLVKNCTKQQKITTELQLLIESAHNLCTLKNKCQEENIILKELVSSQESKEAMASVFDQNASKIQLSKKKRIEEFAEKHQMLQKQLSEENYQQEKFILSIARLKENINENVLAVLETVKKIKKAEADSDEFKSVYQAQLLSIQENFKSDCKSVVEKAKNVFGYKR